MSLFVILFLFTSVLICDCERISVEKVYKNAVEAYSKQDWPECVIQFEESLNLYKLHKAIIVNCRHKCKFFSYQFIIKDDLEDLKTYEKFLLINKCLLACEEEEFERVSLNRKIPDSLLSRLMDLEPYEYLHACYYYIHQIEKAASAAATYLTVHHDDEIMRSNLEQYLKLSGRSVDELVNFEAEKYMVFYFKAMDTYKNKDWLKTIEYMEDAIKNYFASEDNCRAECDQLTQQEWDTDFMNTLSNAVLLLLRCRQNCQTRLNSITYNSGVQFLSGALNYIQICYYNLGKYDDAAEATETFLALNPNDDDMLANKDIYLSLANEGSFVESSNIIYYMKRDTYEKNLLQMYLAKNYDNFTLNTNAIYS